MTDPRFNLQFLKDAKWGHDLVKRYRDLFTQMIEKHYLEEAEPESEQEYGTDEHDSYRMDRLYRVPKKQHGATEISRYLELSRINHTDNIMSWWQDNRQPHRFPRIYRAFRDYHAVQSSSTASERAFSSGGLVITPQRASMTAETLTAIMGVKGKCQFERMTRELELSGIAK